MVERADDRVMEVRQHRQMLAGMGSEVFKLAQQLEVIGRPLAAGGVIGSLVSQVERLGRILDGVLVQEQLRVDLLAPAPGEED